MRTLSERVVVSVLATDKANEIVWPEHDRTVNKIDTDDGTLHGIVELLKNGGTVVLGETNENGLGLLSPKLVKRVRKEMHALGLNIQQKSLTDIEAEGLAEHVGFLPEMVIRKKPAVPRINS